MKFNREKFFDRYRREFGALSQAQVDGLSQLLDGYETYHGWWRSIAHTSNSLSQIKHETNQSFQPVVEGYYLGDASKPNYFQGNTRRVRDFQKRLRYFPHFGMGHIQLTWRENYEEQDQLIRRLFPEIVNDFEQRSRQPFSLIDTPRQILDAKISFAAMTIGMCRGTFTTKKLADYDGENFDHFNARAVVNGDKNYKNDSGVRIGDVIARDARRFERILSGSLIDESAEVAEIYNPEKPSAAEIEPQIFESLPEIGEEVFEQASDPIETTIGKIKETVTQTVETATGSVEKQTTEITDKFEPRNIPAFIPRFGKQWLVGLIPGAGFVSTIIAYAQNAPQWLVFLLGALTGIALWNFGGLLIKHREKVLDFLTKCYEATADPTKHNLIPTADETEGDWRSRDILNVFAAEKNSNR